MNTSPLTPQDKAINHTIPLFFYHIYEVENEIYGWIVDWKPAWEAEKDYASVYHFNGQAAHYWIATDDLSILRKDALLFAIRVHEKKCRVLHIDLSPFDTKEIKNDDSKRVKGKDNRTGKQEDGASFQYRLDLPADNPR